MITMLLGGLWHGASWNFVIWGGMHGAALAVHKLWSTYTGNWENIKRTSLYKLLSWALTALLVGMLWVPFRSPDFSTTAVYFKNLLPDGEGIVWLHPMVLVLLTIVMVWHMVYLFQNRLLKTFPAARPYETVPAFVISGFIMLIVLFAPINTSPFIYFQF